MGVIKVTRPGEYRQEHQVQGHQAHRPDAPGSTELHRADAGKRCVEQIAADQLAGQHKGEGGEGECA